MEILYLDPLKRPPEAYRGAIASIGNFDGVHRGHCSLLGVLRESARVAGRPGLAVTFDPHPLSLIKPEIAPELLCAPQRRAELLCASGADRVIVFQTTREFLGLSAKTFFHDVLRDRLAVAGLVEGPNFFFGRDREGNIETLKELCDTNDVTLNVVDAVQGDGAFVASTRIRQCLAQGDVVEAHRLMGRSHRISGRVEQGDGRGQSLGFPTANLSGVEVMIPAQGVYAGAARLEGETFAAACNIGPNPTFGQEALKVEVHLLDFDQDVYGREVTVELLARLRETRRFDSKQDLVDQLRTDVANTRKHYTDFLKQPARPPICQTVDQWIRQEYDSSLATMGARLEAVEWDDDASPRLCWQLSSALPPQAVQQLLFEIEQRARRVFPELRRVTCTAPFGVTQSPT